MIITCLLRCRMIVLLSAHHRLKPEGPGGHSNNNHNNSNNSNNNNSSKNSNDNSSNSGDDNDNNDNNNNNDSNNRVGDPKDLVACGGIAALPPRESLGEEL